MHHLHQFSIKELIHSLLDDQDAQAQGQEVGELNWRNWAISCMLQCGSANPRVPPPLIRTLLQTLSLLNRLARVAGVVPRYLFSLFVFNNNKET
jgi:hypothetical protein